MTTKKSDENKPMEETEIHDLNNKITDLQQEIQSKDQRVHELKNLILQICNIFVVMDTTMGVVRHDLEEHNDITAGMKIRELSEIIASNQRVLCNLTKGWEKK